MYGSELCGFSFWWIGPIVMMILCLFMMRGRRWTMMGGFGPCNRNWHKTKGAESAMDILDRRYASGDIEKVEYEERKRTLVGSPEAGKV
jgi:uncharacterized membrane protein